MKINELKKSIEKEIESLEEHLKTYRDFVNEKFLESMKGQVAGLREALVLIDMHFKNENEYSIRKPENLYRVTEKSDVLLCDGRLRSIFYVEKFFSCGYWKMIEAFEDKESSVEYIKRCRDQTFTWPKVVYEESF